MSVRKQKSSLIKTVEAIANVDLIDVGYPGGAAYAAFMIRLHIASLEAIADEMEVAAK